MRKLLEKLLVALKKGNENQRKHLASIFQILDEGDE